MEGKLSLWFKHGVGFGYFTGDITRTCKCDFYSALSANTTVKV